MKNQNMICAQHITYLRQKANLKQEELAANVSNMTGRDIPYSPTVVSAWETGRRTPTREAAMAMADLFGTTVEYILGETNIKDESEKSKESSILASNKISYEALCEYHRLPVYLVFPNNEHADDWAIVDCTNNSKIILRTFNAEYVVTKKNYPYDIYPRKVDEISVNANSKKNRLGMIQIMQSVKPVYVEMTTNDAEIRAAYNGYYTITKDQQFLQGESGKVLPLSGLGIRFNCYHSIY